MFALQPYRAVAVILSLALVACNGGDDQANLAQLDAQLANTATDPALRGALGDSIATDPQLAGQSGSHAVSSAQRPASGAIPIVKGDPKLAYAVALKLAGGKLLSAPAPTRSEKCAECARPVTLGAMAKDGIKGGCAADLQYGTQWAQRMPDPFAVYPGGQLMEAAGTDTVQCGLRAVSFVTPVAKKNVLDFYYTQARHAGFDAEHQLMDGANVLGGTRKGDDGAYFILFTDAPGGGTAVDIVANNGR